jgi:SAM-dependent methyltransferase
MDINKLLNINKQNNSIIKINEKDRKFESMDPLQKYGAKETEKVIEEGIKEKLIYEQYKGKVLDFGCGVGGSTYFFNLNNANVVGVDINNNPVQELKNLNILSEENIIVGDGIKLMKTFKEKTFDFVFCLMLQLEDKKIEEFFEEANRILKNSGRIVIVSDIGNLGILKRKYPINAYNGKLQTLFISYRYENPKIFITKNKESTENNIFSKYLERFIS